MTFGILIIIIGIAVLVVALSGQRRFIGLSVFAIFAGVIVTLATGAFKVVPVGSVGVVVNILSGAKTTQIEPGTHFVLPFLENVVLYNARLQELTLSRSGEDGTGDDSIRARSKEGLDISADVTVQFQVNSSKIVTLHKTIGPQYISTVLRPQLRSKVRDAIGQFNAADLISTQRKALESAVTEALRSEFDRSNIELIAVLLRELRIPESVAKAIEQKQTAEQQVAIERNRLQQANIAAQTRVAQADGEAKAAVIKAQAEAQALSLRGEALRKNPEIIQLTVAEKLSPTIQTVMLPSTGNFLLNLGDLVKPKAAQ